MGRDPDADTPALTPELLADLQAGLLDEATAARVRRRVRTDPDAARILDQLDTVRRELAVLGSDGRSAAAVPDDVTARVSAALRAAPGHAVARPRLTRGQRVALALGLTAAAAAVVAGVLVLSGDPGGGFPAGPTASQITVPAAPFPLSDADLRALLSMPPQLGALAESGRLASCLGGLGRSPTQQVLGARTQQVAGRPAVVLLLPGSTAERLDAVVVAPTCSAADTGLVARTGLDRP